MEGITSGSAKDAVDTDSIVVSESVDITVRWRDNSYAFSLKLSAPLLELRMLIEGLTNVPARNQKLIGLTKKIGTKLDDSASLQSHQLAIKNSIVKITLIGTPDAEIAIFQQKTVETVETSTVFNDFSHGYSPATKEWQQLQEFSQKTTINFINQPRAGKKLLVLDLDHTLLDFSSKENINPLEMKVRHILHLFHITIMRFKFNIDISQSNILLVYQPIVQWMIFRFFWAVSR